MKLTINQSLGCEEPEIIINCATIDQKLQRIIDYIRQSSFSIQGTLEGKLYVLRIEDIFYLESVDGTTYVYDKDHVYAAKESLRTLEEYLVHTTFVRISKNTLMNLDKLENIRCFMNHRMEATLTNQEKLVVSRMYMEELKRRLSE